MAHFSVYKTKGLRFEIFAQKSQEQHPFPWHFLFFFFFQEPQKLRLDLSAVSYAASMTACERVSYWEQVGNVGQGLRGKD